MLNNRLNKSTLTIIIISGIALIAILIIAKAFFMPLAIAFILATFLHPISKWLEKLHLGRELSSFLALLALMIFTGGVMVLLIWQFNLIEPDLEKLNHKMNETGLSVNNYLKDNFGLTSAKQISFAKEQGSLMIALIPGFVGYLGQSIFQLLMVLIYTFCFLYFRLHLKNFILKLTREEQKIKIEITILKVALITQQYLLGVSKMIVLLIVMYSIGFSLLGVPNPLFFAMMCGVLEFIPFIGNLTGSVLTFFTAAMHGVGYGVLLGIIGVYLLIQFIQGWILEPLIVGNQVKLNAFFTLMALIAGDLIWGIPGVFIAIPILAMIKIVCDQFETLSAFGYLLGHEVKDKKTPISKSLNFNSY
ncbi:MAG TPA: AI-2E family transporter [Bacteroidia bacterium]